MSEKKLLTCRGVRGRRRSAAAALIGMLASTFSGVATPTVHAQTQLAPVNQGFRIVAGDLRFIFHQIEVAQAHAAGGKLLGPGPNQVNLFGAPNPQLPIGLRTVDGSFNNLVPGQEFFGAADLKFRRLTTPVFRPAQPMTLAGVPGQPVGSATSYSRKSGIVTDSDPRVISNLIVDQTNKNPAAIAANENPCGSGGFVCGGGGTADPVTGSLFIPNITPDFGLSAPFNLAFTFFGQFFDHGLDLVTKGGGTVIMPLQPDDPLFKPGSQTNFMAMDRATNLPGPDGILGTADDIQDGINTTTPWVDQNQTYTSHPSHQVFLREYALNAAGKPVQTGKVLDGDACAPRPTGTPGDDVCDIGNWNQVKAQAATKLGIKLIDSDIFDVPLLLTDPYGHFKPGPNGFPQIAVNVGTAAAPVTGFVEGNPTGGGVAVPANAFRTGHAFLNDIAHSAVPTFVPGTTTLFPDGDTVAGHSLDTPVPAGSYDDELLGLHFITGDGRGNENIVLTAMHNIFHAEHNRLRFDIERQINALLTPQEIAAWHAVDTPSGWDYGERLFQAARFVTEMQYQHLVFEEFARRIQPLINPFLGGLTSIDPAISAEFAHTVYRLGHSMLPEVVARTVVVNGAEQPADMRLFDAFLNPAAFNTATVSPATPGGTPGPTVALTAPQAIGSLIRGLSLQVGNELDEFVVDSVRNTLVGLPLDLAAINIARGRSEGIPSLNNIRKQFFTATRDATVKPYANWFEFGLNLKHSESLVNFVAAYGTDPTITSATTVAAKRAAAAPLVAANGAFMFQSSTTSGLDNVDFWVGGLAERQAVFGGLLGSTFNYVFERQLEMLQDGDRFYYLQRTDGLDLRFQLEGNSFAELIRRNTDFSGGMDIIFSTADFNFNAADLTGTAPINLGDGIQLLTQANGTKMFFDPLHRGKNIVFNGGPGDDKFIADIGDDTLYGNDGNDRLDGFEGNDTVAGGAGDDILFGGNGDDVMKGGPGNDAISGGGGFGGDILIGGDGNDFMLGGDDGVEYFGGPGNDIIVDGAMRSEGMFGGPGDDWIYDGEGHDGGLFGDNGNVFDLLAGIGTAAGMTTLDDGDDVLGGGPGQDNHFGEGGDDIMLLSEGSNKFFGDFGWDWVTLRSWAFPEHIELSLAALPVAPVNFNDLRNFYRFVDGASGWDLDDIIDGDNRVDDPAAEPEMLNQPGMELLTGTPAVATSPVNADCLANATCAAQKNFSGGSGAAKIAGLPQLLTAWGQALPYKAGNILLGGRGSDLIYGGAGDDLIDGDRWLNVQLQANLNDGSVKLVDDPRLLVDDLFADPQLLNPGNISIIRSIVTPVVPPADCNGRVPISSTVPGDVSPTGNLTFVDALGRPAPTPLNCDTAVFGHPINEYDISLSTTGPTAGTITVTHNAAKLFGPPHGLAVNDGVDRLRNIELLRFSDVTVAAPGAGGGVTSVAVPNVVGFLQAAAATTLTNADFTSSSVNANSPTAAIGTVISQSPAAGVNAAFHSNVALSISVGALTPNVVGLLQGTATTAIITTAGLTVGGVTSINNAAVAGTIISQSPVAGTNVAPGTGLALTVSLGPALRTVPNVVTLTQAAATTAIQNAGLTLGAVTNAPSLATPPIPRGSVISSSPAAGVALAAGSAVAIVVSSGAPQPAGLVLALGFDEAAGSTAIDSSVSAHNGTVRQALRVPGKFGNALQFDGVDDWVTVTDTTASPLDLTTGMTLSAWVNPSQMSGWETVMMKERGTAGEGLLSYALYAHDGAPLSQGKPVPAGYVRLGPNPATTVDRAVRGIATVALNQWTHLATTFDGAVQRFFVNGVEVPGSAVATVGSITVSNGSLHVGGNASSTGEFFRGLIDEVRVYNRALTATEITTDMNTAIVR